MLGQRVGDLLPVLDEAILAEVLRDDGRSLAFRHPLIRAALYEGMPAAVRAAWHRDAGRASRRGAPADRVARQLLPALAGDARRRGRRVDRAVAGRRGPQLVGQAPHVAISLLRWAVTGMPAGVPRTTCWRAGSPTRSTGWATRRRRPGRQRRLAHVTRPDLLVDLHWTLIQCRASYGRVGRDVGRAQARAGDAGRRAPAPGPAAGARRTRPTAAWAGWRGPGRSPTGPRRGEGRQGSLGDGLGAERTDGSCTAPAARRPRRCRCSTRRWRCPMAIPPWPICGCCCSSTRPWRSATSTGTTTPSSPSSRYGSGPATPATWYGWPGAERARGAAVRRGPLGRRAGRDRGRLGRVKDPAVECSQHSVAATIGLHRGDAAANAHMADAERYAARMGGRVIVSRALARSLEREQAEAPAKRWRYCWTRCRRTSEEGEETADLFADAVRLAVSVGDRRRPRLVQRAEAVAQDSAAPHSGPSRRTAAGCSTTTRSHCSRRRGLSRPPAGYCPGRRPSEAGGVAFADGGDVSGARTPFHRSVRPLREAGRRLGSRPYPGPVPRVRDPAWQQAGTGGPPGWNSLTPSERKSVGAGRHRDVQPADRGGAVPVPADGSRPTCRHPRQAGAAVADRDRP